jgi:uncharacterized membrane protein YeaQ/YmgE (transglycosylase-associated protein family)
MAVLGWVLVGLVAGVIAKSVHPCLEPRGLVGRLAAGTLGAIGAGLIASAAGIGDISAFFNVGNWLSAITGAVILLVMYRRMTTRPGRRRTAYRF